MWCMGNSSHFGSNRIKHVAICLRVFACKILVGHSQSAPPENKAQLNFNHEAASKLQSFVSWCSHMHFQIMVCIYIYMYRHALLRDFNPAKWCHCWNDPAKILVFFLAGKVRGFGMVKVPLPRNWAKQLILTGCFPRVSHEKKSTGPGWQRTCDIRVKIDATRATLVKLVTAGWVTGWGSW